MKQPRNLIEDAARLRYEHCIFVVDRNGKMVEAWTQHGQLFDVPGGRGPHKIKMSPYDPDKHVWVIDDNLHLIHKFTNDGDLVMTLGERGVAGRDGNHFSRPTDIDWRDPEDPHLRPERQAPLRLGHLGRRPWIPEW